MSENQTYNEKELLSRIAEGDQVAFTQMFNKYYNRIYGKALQVCKVHATAQDVAQQVFMKVWEKRQDLLSVQNPVSWLFAIARYQIADRLRELMMQEKYIRYSLEILDPEIISPEEILINHQKRQLLEKSWKTLSPKQLEVYKMSREQGMTYLEIAEKLTISRDTVKEYMSAALLKIRDYLQVHKNELIIVTLFSHITI